MEITYLKRTGTFSKSPTSILKISNENVLHATQDQLEREETDESIEETAKWYMEVLDYREATKEEFDELFIKTANYINEISKE